MRAGGRERCGRCGANPFAGGEPYTTWIWVPSGSGVEEHALRLCRPCTQGFPSDEERAEYLRLGFFG